MSAIYDNWERLVAAVLKKEELWQLFHDHSRSPSVLSEASDLSSSFHDLFFEFSSIGTSSRLQKSLPKLVLISDFIPAFGVDDLYGASAELLGRGTFGSAYAAAMSNGVKFVVKRLNSASISEQDFKRYMNIIGDISHENVAALRAYYSSEDEKLMLYDYYNKGSVYALLHGQTGASRAHVDWRTRLKVAIGTARGIAEIHTQIGGTLIHGNIKSSNIFLNSHWYGCVSDLGLASMIKTTFVPTAQCYAPEVKSTRNVTQASDVYSFGIVLLELLTRMPTAHIPGDSKPVGLVKLVSSVKDKERAAKVFDADLLKDPTMREDMIKMLQIGIRCVAKSIKKRPKMFEVVRMLEDIIRMNPASHVPFDEDISRRNLESHITSDKQLVFVAHANPIFDIQTLYRASAEFLGRGTFGSCYKAILENGNTIMVKRLRDVIVTYNEFQQHMMVIGRIRHENVVELEAYYFSRDDKLLLYKYYDQGSVSDLLHGTNRTPLDWETRLKIAVGAARGIDHIHRRGDQKLVHGNIKSSNIFLNGRKLGIVSCPGLAKLTRPIMPTPGYRAPEVTDASKVSQASDTYSFGVFIMELVSGKSADLSTDYDHMDIGLVDWIRSVSHEEWLIEVIDLELLGYPNAEAIVQLLQLALDCVSVAPERRPRMPEVVKILEQISGLDPCDESSLEDVLEETLEQPSIESRLDVEEIWEQPSIESRLEDLLENLLPILAP